MTYIFYKDIIGEIALHLNFQQIVHLLSRDYSDESVVTKVHEANPFYIDLNDDDKSSKKKSVSIQQIKQLGSVGKA